MNQVNKSSWQTIRRWVSPRNFGSQFNPLAKYLQPGWMRLGHLQPFKSVPTFQLHALGVLLTAIQVDLLLLLTLGRPKTVGVEERT